MPPDSTSADALDGEVKETTAKSSTAPSSKITNDLRASTTFPTTSAETPDSQCPNPTFDSPLPPVQSLPLAITEAQRLSLERIATYLADPIGTLPQYTHNTSQRSIEHHEVILKAQLEKLSTTIDNHDK